MSEQLYSTQATKFMDIQKIIESGKHNLYMVNGTDFSDPQMFYLDTLGAALRVSGNTTIPNKPKYSYYCSNFTNLCIYINTKGKLMTRFYFRDEEETKYYACLWFEKSTIGNILVHPEIIRITTHKERPSELLKDFHEATYKEIYPYLSDYAKSVLRLFIKPEAMKDSDEMAFLPYLYDDFFKDYVIETSE